MTTSTRPCSRRTQTGARGAHPADTVGFGGDFFFGSLGGAGFAFFAADFSPCFSGSSSRGALGSQTPMASVEPSGPIANVTSAKVGAASRVSGSNVVPAS